MVATGASAAAGMVSPRVAAFTAGVGLLLYPLLRQQRQLRVDPSRCIVVLTGCDSGFGNMAARQLARGGHLVVAGCLTAAGAEQLKQLEPAVTATVICDVTKQDHIDRLYATVEQLLQADKERRLWAVVNNAGH